MAPEKTIKFHDIPVKINKMDLPPERKSQSWRRTAKPWVPRCRRPWSVIKELGGSNYRCKMILGKSTLWNQYFNTTCNGHMIHMVWIWSDRAYEHCYDRYNIYIHIYYRHIIYHLHTHKHGHRTYAYRNERISTRAKWMIRRSSVSLENKWIASWRRRCPEIRGVWDQWGYS